METNTNQADIRDRINRLFRDFLGSNTDFSLDKHLKAQGLQDISTLNQTQKRQFAEDLIDKVIRPAASSGKTSMARVELMSILRIGVEPWKITADYVPSPREHLLAHEMNEEFQKLNRQTIYAEVARNNLRERVEPDQHTKNAVITSVIATIFGTMPKTTLVYTKKLFNKRPIEWVVKNSLSAYMKNEEARESAKNLTQMFGVLVKAKDDQIQPNEINMELLSEKLRDDFTDTNQVVIRRLKNELNIDDMKTVNEAKKQRIMQTLMTHYFGQMSDKYLSLEAEKMKLNADTNRATTDKMRLINAIIYDCLHTTMAAEDAKLAHTDLSFLINP
ncbi:MAG: hypothetical protein V1875_03615 [Candidatus Altiarchaeota archaeon]